MLKSICLIFLISTYDICLCQVHYIHIWHKLCLCHHSDDHVWHYTRCHLPDDVCHCAIFASFPWQPKWCYTLSGSSPWQPRMKLYYVSSCLWQRRKLDAMCACFSDNPVWCSIMGGLLAVTCDAVSVCAIWSTMYDATVCLWPTHVMLYRGCIISWITVFICHNSTTD